MIRVFLADGATVAEVNTADLIALRTFDMVHFSKYSKRFEGSDRVTKAMIQEFCRQLRLGPGPAEST